MSTSQSATPEDTEANAQRLVGKFLQNFALLELAVDDGIGKLLRLDAGVRDIVAANVPFARKVSILFSTENHLGELPDNDRKNVLKQTRSSIMELNTDRVMFAHSTFVSDGDGVRFKRATADNKLVVESKVRTAAEVDSLCTKAAALAAEVHRLVDEMEPYVMKADFRDPRNSSLAAFLLF